MQNGYNEAGTRPSAAREASCSGAETEAPAVSVSAADYLYFAERAVRGMERIVVELGDEKANRRPALPRANTPYGLLTHCLGVMDYWGGALVAGRTVRRDREGEFTARGTVAALRAQVDRALEQLRRDVAASASAEPLRAEPDPSAQGPDRVLTQGAALLHLYEELAQHHGQLEVMRDALIAQDTASPAYQTSNPRPESRPSKETAIAAPARLRPEVFDAEYFNDLPLDWLRAKRGVKWHGPGPDLLPAWVADMDYPVAPVIRDALTAAVERGDLGYPDWSAYPLAEPFARRMDARYQWSPDPGHVRPITDIIQAVQVVLTLWTEPGDGVVLFTPSYPPFLATIAGMRRTLIPAQLELSGRADDPQARWTWDEERLDAAARQHRAKVLLLVNPHNPTGKAFTAAELERVAQFAARHGLTVISDEIHAELAHPPTRHLPFASLSAETAARTVTVTSATKAFNIAGLRAAVAHVAPSGLRERWDAQPPDLFGAVNVLGVEATLAAWERGDPWLAGLTAQLTRQRDHLAARLPELSGVTMRPPEAGYLAWLDFSGVGGWSASFAGPGAWLREHAGVELSEGSNFGPGNAHRARLNFATSTAILDTIIDRIRGAITEA